MGSTFVQFILTFLFAFDGGGMRKSAKNQTCICVVGKWQLEDDRKNLPVDRRNRRKWATVLWGYCQGGEDLSCVFQTVTTTLTNQVRRARLPDSTRLEKFLLNPLQVHLLRKTKTLCQVLICNCFWFVLSLTNLDLPITDRSSQISHIMIQIPHMLNSELELPWKKEERHTRVIDSE